MKLNRLLALLMAFVMTFMVATCAVAETTTSDSDVLITVNGTQITRGEIVEVASNLLYSYEEAGYDTTDESLLSYIYSMAVEFSIQYALLDQQAALLGYDQFTAEELAELETEAAAQWAEIVDYYVTYFGGMLDSTSEEEALSIRAELISMLESYGYSEAVLLESLKENVIYERIEAAMVAGATVTEEDVLAYYETCVTEDESIYANDIATYEYYTQYYGIGSYYTPEGYRGILHILLEVDETLLTEYQTLLASFEEQANAEDGAEVSGEVVTQEQVDAAEAAVIASVQTTIDEIYARLANGEQFQDLIPVYGTDPGMEDPTTLAEGYPVHMDSIVWDPAFVSAAFSIDTVGGWSQPSLGSYGIYIAYYLRDIPAGAPELTEEAKAELQAQLLTEKEDELFTNKLNEWYEAATIIYSEELMGE